jgi:hypothetical protein
MSYGYNLAVAFSKASINIKNTAEELLDRLGRNHEQKKEKTGPILLISHRLGGLIVKKVIAHS